jgi:hypothetical protein
MNKSAKLMTTYHVRQDNGAWSLMRGREESLGFFRIKADAIRHALDQARQHPPSLVSVELADGRIEDELRFGSTDAAVA